LLYPSLEDMKTAEMISAQVSMQRPHGTHEYHPTAPVPTLPRNGSPYMTGVAPSMASAPSVYPTLGEFLGLELSEEMIRANMPEYLLNAHGAVAIPTSGTVAVPRNNLGIGIVAPISGNTAVMKSMVTHGVRSANVLKDNKGKIGLRVRAMHTGVFVCLVMDGSPAAKTGLRFGDQILQIDGVDMAGMTVDKVHAIFKKKKSGESLQIAIRDRPYERSVTLVRDSLGNIGFQFRDGKIINIVKDSSAARNGLLTEHSLLEINGKNVIGLKDKEITKVIQGIEENALNVTIMPSFLYEHMVKEMNSSLFGKMDHSDQL